MLEVRVNRSMQHDAVLIMSLVGQIDAYTYVELSESLDRALTDGEKWLILDLSRLGSVDQVGLGVLVKAVSSLDRVGGQLRLIHLSQELLDSLAESRLDSLFEGRIARDEDAALAGLARYLPLQPRP